jgi:hypothetical protein
MWNGVAKLADVVLLKLTAKNSSLSSVSQPTPSGGSNFLQKHVSLPEKSIFDPATGTPSEPTSQYA